MELAYKIQEAFRNGRNPLRKELAQLSLEVFGESIKDNCDSCIPKLIRRLKQYAETKAMATGCKYRISKKYAGKTFTVVVAGTPFRISNANISNATAEMIMNNPNLKKDIIELNPDYGGVEVKKNILLNEPEPLSLTSIEALNDGKKSAENVSVKESVTKESVPLMEEPKKRGLKLKSKPTA